eukprot:4112197-Ditylum_brightwellii.AAC.1
MPLSDEDDLTDDEIGMAINSSKTTTIGQKAILTQSKLKKEANLGEWLTAEKTHLDSMEDLQMYGEPTYAPKGAKVLHSVWTYMIKYYWRKKARN